MKFSKMQALGNDYIYLDGINQEIKEPNILAQKLCNRHFQIGSDGLIIAEASSKADLKMRVFNPDGSEAQMCGNALRSIAKFAYLNKLVPKTHIFIETLGGIKEVFLDIQDSQVVNIKANIGQPIFKPSLIPLDSPKDKFIEEELTILDKKFKVSALSWGNPHAVVFVPDVANFAVSKYGPAIENHHLFLEKTNVTFVEVLDKNHLFIREWERGTGETLACATGCASALVIANLLGLCSSHVLVKQLGGTLKLSYDLTKGLTMEGPSTLVFEGELKNI